MNHSIIGKQKDSSGRTRIYVLPVKTEEDFKQLIKFIFQEFDCKLEKLDEGPGTLIQKIHIKGRPIIFVMSDCTGAQFYAEVEDDLNLVEIVASEVATKLFIDDHFTHTGLTRRCS
jgi:hypothetical protein